jgi:hypothetical protein
MSFDALVDEAAEVAIEVAIEGASTREERG